MAIDRYRERQPEERFGMKTEWAGVQYDSRMEARFHVLLRALGIDAIRAPGILRVGEHDGKADWYEPDFVLPDWNLHVELKPSLEVLQRFPDEIRKPLLLAMWPMPVLLWLWNDEVGVLLTYDHDTVLFGWAVFNACPSCNRPLLEVIYGDRATRLSRASLDEVFRDGFDAIARIVKTGIEGDPASACVYGHEENCPNVIAVDAFRWRRAMALARGWRPE